MRVLIVGAGAVGQGLGGFLAAGGHDVTLLLRPRFREAIAREGLALDGVLGERRIAPGQVHLAGEEGELDAEYDFVLVCVKSYDTPTAGPIAARAAGETGVVVSAQNGYGNVETLSESIDGDRVLCARVITGFEIPRPGRVHVSVHADAVHVGSFRRGDHPAAAVLAGALAAAGVPCEAVADIQADLWGKILYNCALNPLGAILGVQYGALGEREDTRAVMDTIIDEVFAVVRAGGFACPWPDAQAFRRVFYRRQLPATYDHHPSMLQDLRAGKPTEIDALNGAVVRLGRRLGVPTPVNHALAAMVRFRESPPASPA